MANVSNFLDKLKFRTVNTAQGELGYIRIRSFHLGYWDVDSFVAEVARICGRSPRTGS